MGIRTLFSAVACAALTACGTGPWVTVQPVAVQPVASPPPVVLTSARVDYVEATPDADLEVVAPQVVYEGRPTYYYQNRWYYREGAHWRYYRTEPLGLVEHRRRIEAQPPPRHEEPSRGREQGHHDDRHDEGHHDHR